MSPKPQPEQEAPGWLDAAGHAVRILQYAEGETNLAMAEVQARIAEAWIALATILRD